MKKYIGFILLTGVLLGAPLVRAEDGRGEKRFLNNTRPAFNKEMFDERKEFREQMQVERSSFQESLRAEREAFRKEVEIKREEWRLANAEKRNDFWGKARIMVGERFTVAVSKLEAMQDRVALAIAELEGEDTSVAEEALDSSEDKLAQAVVKIDQIKALLPDDGEKITPEIFEQIKLLAREAKDLLKESKEYLRESIKEIKELSGVEDESEDEDENEDDEEENN